jgi:hypothetical protein
MAQVTVELSLRPKWWMRPALASAALFLRLGLIRDAASPEHFGGVITAEERVAKWLADYAFMVECR